MAAERHIAQALAALRARYGTLLLSSTYQSPAAGFEGDDFLNLAVGIDTDETPEAVMRSLREIEDACGRIRGGPKFSARTMDLDLLTYGDQISATPPLPRADILEYNFVLGPLAEIAGHVLHPQLRQSYADLWAAMQARTEALQLFAPAPTRSGDSANG